MQWNCCSLIALGQHKKDPNVTLKTQTSSHLYQNRSSLEEDVKTKNMMEQAKETVGKEKVRMVK